MTIKGSVRRKEFRRQNAKEAAERRASITDQQQLAKLDSMFGEGKGAQRERARLAKRIAGAKQKDAIKTEKAKKKAAKK